MKSGAVVIYGSTVYPGGYRGDLYSDTGARIGLEVDAGFLHRLLAGTSNLGDKKNHCQDHQGGFG